MTYPVSASEHIQAAAKHLRDGDAHTAALFAQAAAETGEPLTDLQDSLVDGLVLAQAKGERTHLSLTRGQVDILLAAIEEAGELPEDHDPAEVETLYEALSGWSSVQSPRWKNRAKQATAAVVGAARDAVRSYG